MARASFGTCESCGARKSKGAMVAHLKSCLPRQLRSGGSADSAVVLLRTQAAGSPAFWLDLAVKGDAKLKDVDRFLRRIWLECCGHMSEFYSGSRRKVSMSTKLSEAIGPRERLGYVYDFGSSTELVISSSGRVEGQATKAVRLVARNEPPMWPCSACGEPATAVCGQCVYEGNGFCCSVHAASHDCGEEMLLPVVNSPRMGVCGYTGEA
jgi:hypothetical protein